MEGGGRGTGIGDLVADGLFDAEGSVDEVSGRGERVLEREIRKPCWSLRKGERMKWGIYAWGKGVKEGGEVEN